jgi:phosphatidylinositol glycan class O
LLWQLASAGAAVAMVLGYKGPGQMLLAFVQAAAALALLALASSSSSSSSDANSAVGASMRGAAVAAGMAATQLFYATGHFCEFSGLHYAASFIGLDEVAPVASAALLGANTLGCLALAAASAPLAAAVAWLAAHSGSSGSSSSSSSNGVAAALGVRAAHSEPSSSFYRCLAAAALAVCTGRAAALAACIWSSAVQQRHILVWAVFAPKLAFELLFAAAADAALLASTALVAAWL